MDPSAPMLERVHAETKDGSLVFCTWLGSFPNLARKANQPSSTSADYLALLLLLWVTPKSAKEIQSAEAREIQRPVRPSRWLLRGGQMLPRVDRRESLPLGLPLKTSFGSLEREGCCPKGLQAGLYP